MLGDTRAGSGGHSRALPAWDGADAFVQQMPGWFRLDRAEGQTHDLHVAAEKDTLRQQLTGWLAETGIRRRGGLRGVAVTPEQIITHGLPTVLQDRRGPLDRVTLPRVASALCTQPVRRGWSGTSRGFG
ncbi:hypothetical protein [Streptomyces sp. NPDC020965]|uniref:hypothetical protein n=1 Tax=Streptomyces sp. NPDC020965 TaxID=3365105 RepID=UPI0037B4B93A